MPHLITIFSCFCGVGHLLVGYGSSSAWVEVDSGILDLDLSFIPVQKIKMLQVYVELNMTSIISTKS